MHHLTLWFSTNGCNYNENPTFSALLVMEKYCITIYNLQYELMTLPLI